MSLTDRTNGYCARRIRERMGSGTDARVKAQADRLDRLERMLAYQLRSFRGLVLERPGAEIVPGSDGWISLSTDTYAQLERDPNNNPHHGKLTIDTNAIDTEIGACSAAITSIVDCDSDTQAATTCAATLAFQSSDGTIGIQHLGTVNAQILDLTTCFGSGVQPPADPLDQWPYGLPDVWIAISVGDPCTGGCTTYNVPAWEVAV